MKRCLQVAFILALLPALALADSVRGTFQVGGKTLTVRHAEIERTKGGFIRLLLTEKKNKVKGYVDKGVPYGEICFWFDGGKLAAGSLKAATLNLYGVPEARPDGTATAEYSWKPDQRKTYFPVFQPSDKRLRLTTKGSKVTPLRDRQQPVTWDVELNLQLPTP